ncbi:MAG: ABC transporter substrate-binding protein [Deltaproteobacteria bacterium]|nr:ABC transporter substrate-binding protein [Deltaproteobacteria bacterium]
MKGILTALYVVTFFCGSIFAQDKISIATEFNTHAAAFYVALDKGFFDREQLKIKSYEAYVTGVALASSLKRGDIEAAFICLPPTITSFVNGGVKLRIISGLHLYGYGLVSDGDKIKHPRDLEKKGLKIGCVREGSGTDLILRKTVEKYRLNEDVVLSSVLRMNPPNMLFALKSGSLDACFLPEHYLSLAEKEGFKIILTAKDIWPDFLGSVLVVKNEVLEKKPKAVRSLNVAIKKATEWIITNKEDSARIIAKYLTFEAQRSGFVEKLDPKTKLSVTENEIRASMSRVIFTNDVNRDVVQDVINFMDRKGYLKGRVAAKDLIYTGF